jgi:hypothetical protein
MSRRETTVVECDNCDRKTETDDPTVLPRSWKRVMISEGGRDHPFDVCSVGCAERAMIGAVRAIWDVPDMPDELPAPASALGSLPERFQPGHERHHD